MPAGLRSIGVAIVWTRITIRGVMDVTETTWEGRGFNWDVDGFDGRKITPFEVLALVLAEKESDAEPAYRNMENNIFKNNTAFSSAVPVFKMILSMLPMTKGAGRALSLEMLELILFCKGPQSIPGVVEQCEQELRLAAWFLFHGIQFDNPELIWIYSDLIRLLGDAFPDLRPKCRFYLRNVLEREIPGTATLSSDTVDGLRTMFADGTLWPAEDP